MIIVCPRRCRRRVSRASAVSSSGNLTLLQAAPGPKYKAAVATAYGAGLHVSEGLEGTRRPHRRRALGFWQVDVVGKAYVKEVPIGDIATFAISGKGLASSDPSPSDYMPRRDWNETSAPKFSSSGRGRYRAAGRVAHRVGAAYPARPVASLSDLPGGATTSWHA